LPETLYRHFFWKAFWETKPEVILGFAGNVLLSFLESGLQLICPLLRWLLAAI